MTESALYEGPFQNLTAIHFPADEIPDSFRVYDPFTDSWELRSLDDLSETVSKQLTGIDLRTQAADFKIGRYFGYLSPSEMNAYDYNNTELWSVSAITTPVGCAWVGEYAVWGFTSFGWVRVDAEDGTGSTTAYDSSFSYRDIVGRYPVGDDFFGLMSDIPFTQDLIWRVNSSLVTVDSVALGSRPAGLNPDRLLCDELGETLYLGYRTNGTNDHQYFDAYDAGTLARTSSKDFVSINLTAGKGSMAIIGDYLYLREALSKNLRKINRSGTIVDTFVYPNTFSSIMHMAPIRAAQGIEVISITPEDGSTSGGDTVTVTGAGFAAGMEVYFDGLIGTGLVVLSPTACTIVSPAHGVGFSDIVVAAATTNQQDIIDSAFLYI